jgi:hypothetical protein
LGHVINLGNVNVINCITKITMVENPTAIWEYNLTLDDNHVLGGLLDVIATIWTLAIKVCANLNEYLPFHRSRHQDNESNTFRAPTSGVESPTL